MTFKAPPDGAAAFHKVPTGGAHHRTHGHGTHWTGGSTGRRSRIADDPHVGKYRLIKTIGKGNFAKVKLARHTPTGKEVSLLN